jgi:hypothetical protein
VQWVAKEGEFYFVFFYPPALEQKEAANKLAQWIILQGQQGPVLEDTVVKREAVNPLFSFLFGGPYYEYYQLAKLNCIVASMYGGRKEEEGGGWRVKGGGRREEGGGGWRVQGGG